MRLFVVNCLLLASLGAALPNERHKRDFATIRKWISSNFFDHPRQITIQTPSNVKDKDYKLFSLPGYDNIIVKVTPKEETSEKVVVTEAKPIDLKAFSRVIGTKDKEDTVKSLKEVNNLVSSGILIGKGNEVIRESLVPMFSKTPQYVRNDEAVIETMPLIESREPSLTEVIVPEEKLEIEVPIKPKYSYIQLENNKPSMVYKAHYSKPVAKVTESIEMKSVVPSCIRERIDDVIQWGANPVRAAFPDPPEQFADITNPGFNAAPDTKNIFYPVVETENISAQIAAEIAAEVGVFQHMASCPYYFHKERPVKTRTINRRPVQLFSHKPTHSYTKTTTTTERPQDDEDADETKIDSRIGISHTLGPIPPQYVHQVTSSLTEVPIAPKADRTVRVEDSKNKVTNAMIPSNVYDKQSSPTTAVLLKEDGLKTNKEVKSAPNAPTYFYYVPPKIKPGSGRNKFSTSTTNKGAYTNKISPGTQKVAESVKTTTTTTEVGPLKENAYSLFKNNPIVIPEDKMYTYVQRNPDGSVMTMKSTQNGVSVDVSESRTKYRSRGDIPGDIGEI